MPAHSGTNFFISNVIVLIHNEKSALKTCLHTKRNYVLDVPESCQGVCVVCVTKRTELC